MQVGFRPTGPGGAVRMNMMSHPPPNMSGMPPMIPPPNMSIPPPNHNPSTNSSTSGGGGPPPASGAPSQQTPQPAAPQHHFYPSGFHHPPPPGMIVPSAMMEMGFDGKMLRKTIARKTVDFNSSCARYLEDRVWKRDCRDERSIQADALYTPMMTLPQGLLDNPVNCVMTKFIRAALNKDPRPIFTVCWTPDGRRLITGASSGEFTLWNGLTFNFETILQAHNSSVRNMIWSHNEQWMVTGDDKGYVKYWQANMNNVKMFQGHLEAIRGLSFSPNDSKFASCSDDRTVRVFDFTTSTEENVLQGHGSDVKCVDWHPFKSLIISGSKDSQQPIILWDPRTKKKITTLHAHKNTCTDLKWNQFNGNWLISSSRDHLCKLFDIRNLKEEVQAFRGHKKEVNTLAWHPIYEKMFVSAGADGSLFYWTAGAEKELGSVEEAHEGMIWGLSWHPLGHILVSGSNDRSTRFWTRNRPGDVILDKTDEMQVPKPERATGIIFKNIELQAEADKLNEISLPGLGLEKGDTLASIGENKSSEESSTLFNNSSQNVNNNRDNIDSNDYDDEETKRRKISVYTKPVPREFEKAWGSSSSSSAPSSSSHHHSGKTPLLQLPNQPPLNHNNRYDSNDSNGGGMKRKLNNQDDDQNNEWTSNKGGGGGRHHNHHHHNQRSNHY